MVEEHKKWIEKCSSMVDGTTRNGAGEGGLAQPRGQVDPEIGRLWCQSNVRPRLGPHITSHLQSFAARVEADSDTLLET